MVNGAAGKSFGTGNMIFEKVAEVWRGPVVESMRYGVAAVANASGEILHSWGDPTFITYPRSSLKPIQAVALVETGAHEAYGLDYRHLALACASHSGEPFHADLVSEWLKRLGLSEDALACGPAYPGNDEDLHDLIRAGQGQSSIYHNCSGKHCGFLTVARHMGWAVDGYNDLDHPAQQRYLDVLSELLGRDARALAIGVDHCTLPAPALPVGDMAVAMARFAAARVSSATRKAAILRIHDAARRYPEYLSGTGQPYVQLIRATEGRVIVQGGAEGYLAAFLPEEGMGIALKIADGDSHPPSANRRSRFAVLLTLLKDLKLLASAAEKNLRPFFEVPITNSVGETVGCIRPCPPRAEPMAVSPPRRSSQNVA